MPTPLHGVRNGCLPSPPGRDAPRPGSAGTAIGHVRSALDWAPCGFDTADKLKASFRSQLSILSTEIDTARGRPFAINAAYAAFAEKSQALLAACTPARMDAASVERIATVARQTLEGAPQPPRQPGAVG